MKGNDLEFSIMINKIFCTENSKKIIIVMDLVIQLKKYPKINQKKENE